MQALYSRFLLLLILISFLSCSSEEVYPTLQAQFDSSERVLVGQPISISDVTLGAAGYVWDFGNGLTSADQLPQGIIYLEPGIYTISLTVISVGQAQTTMQRQVIVGQYQSNRMELLEVDPDFRNMDMNIYYTISEIQTPPGDEVVEKEIFRSDRISGVNSNRLPFNFEIDGIPLGGYGYMREQNPVIRIFNADTGDVIAANGRSIMGTRGWKHEFGTNFQSGNFIATAASGNSIRVYYQAVYPNL